MEAELEDALKQVEELKRQLEQSETKKQQFEMQVEAMLDFNEQIKNLEVEEQRPNIPPSSSWLLWADGSSRCCMTDTNQTNVSHTD